MNTSRILAFAKSKKISTEDLNKISGGNMTLMATGSIGPNNEHRMDVAAD